MHKINKIIWQRLIEPGDKTGGFFTPMGRFPRDFKFWYGHTNFNLSEARLKMIETTDGVESLEVFSPYRFRISIGLAFDSSEVRKAIQDKFQVTHKEEQFVNPEILSKINELKDKITKNNWVIYVSPNGEISYFESDEEKEVFESSDFYETAQKKVGGLLFNSWSSPA